MSDPRSIIREAEHGLICGDSELQKVCGIAYDLISELDSKIKELETQLSESEYFEDEDDEDEGDDRGLEEAYWDSDMGCG